MDDLQEQIRAAEADIEAAVQRLQELRAQIPKPPPVCQACGRPAIWEDYHHGDYMERYCAEHYHEFIKFLNGDLSEWAAAVAGEALVASNARVAELDALLFKAQGGGEECNDEQYINRLEWAVVWLAMMLTGGLTQREQGPQAHKFDAEYIRRALHVREPGAMPAPQRRELDAARAEVPE